MSNDVEARPKLGISSCLLGNEVRYDGGHKHNAYIRRTLGEYFDFIPFCPEVAIGLSTPRPPIRLIDDGESVRVLGTDDSSLDYTANNCSMRKRHNYTSSNRRRTDLIRYAIGQHRQKRHWNSH